MRTLILFAALLINGVLFGQGAYDSTHYEGPSSLGAFSISLSVKDLKTSKKFYETLGFMQTHGGMEQNYLIMKNGSTVIGLFQGMFEGNMMTFNPGWDQSAQPMQEFDDVRTIQDFCKENGIQPTLETDKNGKGPGSIILTDPDGNMILIDQHAE